MAVKKNTYITAELDFYKTREIDWNFFGFSGIYMILNIINSKFYIGSAIDLYKRKSGHLTKLKKNEHKNPHLQAAYNKYGSENFKVLLMTLWRDVDSLLEVEQYYIDTFHPQYNINKLATGRRGTKMPKETIEKQILRQCKKVCQYNEFGDFIKEYESLNQVFTDNNWRKSGGLSSHLKGDQRIYKGYFWSFKNEKPIIKPLERVHNKKIKGFNKERKLLYFFPSIKKASETLNISRVLISNVLTGKLKTTHKLIFNYGN